MAELREGEPQTASEYDDRTTRAVKSVLVEVGQILGSFEGKFALIGGAVPWLLLDNEDMPHVGSLDVDLTLDAEALGDGQYATLVEALQEHGYEQRPGFRRFQLVRRVPATDDGPPIDVIVDFLMQRDAEIVKNNPPLVAGFAVQRADGADLAALLSARRGGWHDAGRRHEQGRDGSLHHSGADRHEGACPAAAAQAEGRLRRLLQHPQLSGRHRGAGRRLPAAAGA
jgi:hypothetical protein